MAHTGERSAALAVFGRRLGGGHAEPHPGAEATKCRHLLAFFKMTNQLFGKNSNHVAAAVRSGNQLISSYAAAVRQSVSGRTGAAGLS